MGTKNVNKQLETVVNAFPVQFTEEITYDLLHNDIEVVYNEKEKSRKYYINVIILFIIHLIWLWYYVEILNQKN